MSGIGTSGNDEIHDDGSATTIDGGDGDDLLVMDLSAKTDSQHFALWPYPTNGYTPDYKSIEHLQIVTGSGDDIGNFTDVIYDTTWGGDSWDAGVGNDLANIDMTGGAIPIKVSLSGNGQMTISERGTGNPLLALSNVENYAISGTSGDDILTDHAADDFSAGVVTFDGGAGKDTVTLPYATRLATSMTFEPDGTIAVNDGTPVSLQLRNIETLDLGSDEFILGTAGNDTLSSTSKTYGLLAGPGDDVIHTTANVHVDGGSGTDTVVLATSTAHVRDIPGSFANVEYLQLDDAKIRLGSDAADTFGPIAGVSGYFTGNGDDIITPGAGIFTINGGSGNDTVILPGSLGDYTVARNDSADGIVLTAGANSYSLTNVETVQLGNANVISGTGSLTGTAADDLLVPIGAWQSIDGGGGTDVVLMIGSIADWQDSSYNFANVEYLQFSDGKIRMGSDAADVFSPTPGVVGFSGGGGDDTITPGAGVFIIGGSSGYDTVNLSGNLADYVITYGGQDGIFGPYWDSSRPLILTVGANVYTLSSVEKIQFASGDVIADNTGGGLTGTAGDDLLVPLTSETNIDGGGGTDTLRIFANESDAQIYFWPDGHVSMGLDNASWSFTNVEQIQFDDVLLLFGTSGNDDFSGTDGDDAYAGELGDDTLSGGKGNDTLTGNEGNDILSGGDGDDTLEGGSGDNAIGDNSSDFLSGGDGNDTLKGGPGDNTLLGGAGDDTLESDGGGKNSFNGGAGNDNLVGSNYGQDTAIFSGTASQYTISGKYTDAGLRLVVKGPDGTDTLTNIRRLQFDDGLLIPGTDSDDVIEFDDGSARISTGKGNDRIFLNGGDAIVDGGDGNDSIAFGYLALNDILSFGYDAAGNMHFVTQHGSATLISVENATEYGKPVMLGTDGADVLTGATAIYVGGKGNDQITDTAGRGTAMFSGAPSDYVITLGAGNTIDTVGPDGHDSLTGIAHLMIGNYTFTFASDGTLQGSGIGPVGGYVIGTAADNSLIAGPGDDYIDGGAGFDTYTYGDTLSGVSIAIGADGTATIGGGDGTDTLRNVEAVTLRDGNLFYMPTLYRLGTAGNDTVTAQAGVPDGFAGGAGDDVFTFALHQSESFLGGDGNDLAIMPDAIENYGVALGLGDVVYMYDASDMYKVHTVRQVETVQFTDGVILTGDDGDNVLTGTTGNDDLIGGAGNDQLNGGGGNDAALFYGSMDEYTLSSDGATTIVSGPDGTDTLTGISRIYFENQNENNMVGGSGTGLVGTNGADTLTLGNGYSGGIVLGLGGNDTITASRGESYIDGGDGYDTAIIPMQALLMTVEFRGDGSVVFYQQGVTGPVTLKNVEQAQFTDYTLRIGTSGDDTMVGTAGSDYFLPGPGNDVIDGGPGDDIVLYSGSLDDLSVVKNSDGSYTVYGPDGVDTLRNVEYVGFDGEKVAARKVPHDLDGDGRADILWQNDDGTAAVWLLNSATLLGGDTIGNPGSASWKAIGTGDFNGDGKADILWQNADGTPAIWLMTGSTLTGGGIAGGNPGPAWTELGAADFDGDGKSDILWRAADGSIAVWLMDGATLKSGAIVGTPGPGWRYVGTGDFNQDGKTDLVFQHSDGTVVVWAMNGTSYAGYGLFNSPGANWTVRGIGDFNGDGVSDILFQDSSGQAAVWLTNSFKVSGGGLVGSNPGTGWTIKSAEDVNGDGKADILWQASDGSPAVWLMSGANVIGGNPGAAWHIVTG